MTTKENSTLEARALAVINSADFNRDTRRAVELSLNDLRETVAQAERGDTVLDATDPELEDPPPTLAELVSAVLRHPDTPADLYNAVAEVLADLSSPRAVNEDPAVIAVALKVRAEYEAQKGGAK